MRTAILLAVLYGLACVAALLLVPINARGWLGMTPDPLTGLLAILLAMPWSLGLQLINAGPAAGLALVILGMAANVAIILAIGRGLSRRRA